MKGNKGKAIVGELMKWRAASASASLKKGNKGKAIVGELMK